MKKILSWLLVCVMVVGMLPVASFAAAADHNIKMVLSKDNVKFGKEVLRVDFTYESNTATVGSLEVWLKFDASKVAPLTAKGADASAAIGTNMKDLAKNMAVNGYVYDDPVWGETDSELVYALAIRDAVGYIDWGVTLPDGTPSFEDYTVVASAYFALKDGVDYTDFPKNAIQFATTADAAVTAQTYVAYVSDGTNMYYYGSAFDNGLAAPVIVAGDGVTFAKEAITGTVAITGSTIVGGTLSLDTTVPAGYTVSWQYADTNAVIGTEATYTTDEDDIGKSIKAVLSHADYSGSKESAPVTITDKTAPTANAPAGVTATYGQKLSEIALTNPAGNTAGTWAWKTPAVEVGNVGNNQFVAVFTPDDTANYATVEKPVSVAVSALSITPEIAPIAPVTYTGSQHTPEITVKIFGTEVVLKKDVDYTVTYGENINVATGGSVEIAPVAGSNYTFDKDAAAAKTTFVIVKAGSTVTYNGSLDKTYDRDPVAATGATVTGSTGAVTYKYFSDAACTAEIAAPKDAGTYYVKAFVAADANCNAAESAAKSFTISKAGYAYAGPDGVNTTVVINTAVPAVSNLEADGVNGEKVTGTVAWYSDEACTAAVTKFPGEANAAYKLYWKFTPVAGQDNYVADAKTGSVTFNVTAKKPVEVTFANAATKDYVAGGYTLGEQFTAATVEGSRTAKYQYNGTVYETLAALTEKVTAVGTYTVTAFFEDETYYGETSATFTIEKADSTVTYTGSLDKEYDGNAVAATGATATGSTGAVTYKYFSDVACTAEIAAPVNVGTYYVKAYVAADDNYNAAESAAKSFTISKATYAAPAKPTGSYEVSTTDATQFVYTVTAVAGAEYSKDGTNWQDSNVFDGIAPDATVTFSVRLKADDNHNASPATAGDAVKFVKLANTNVPALKYTVTGTVGNRTITITEVAGAEYKFGTGAWGNTNTYVDNTANGSTIEIAIRYAATVTLKESAAATASVNTAKTAQTVTAPAVTFEYGNTGKIVPTASSKNFTYEVTAGADVISVDANGVVTALKAGSAQVTVTALEDETYAQATVVVNVTVNKVKVTVKADDVQLKINGELPASYTYTVTGLKGTDALTATVAVKDGATPDVSKAGEYVLVASGATFTAGSADNYEITYVDGTLSIKNNIVVIPVAPKPDEDEPVEPEKPVVPVIGGVFTDVKADDWFAGAVEYVYENGLMDGMGNNQFAPYGTTTRGQIVTILWRLEGKPLPSITNPFSDVGYSEWYSTAITWAAEHKIVNGVTTTTFDPTAPITREQIAAILYRYAQYKGYDMTAAADLGTYADAASVSGYAVNAMKWACGTGLINGIDGALAPSGTAIRCQAATLLMRFCENVAK